MKMKAQVTIEHLLVCVVIYLLNEQNYINSLDLAYYSVCNETVCKKGTIASVHPFQHVVKAQSSSTLSQIQIPGTNCQFYLVNSEYKSLYYSFYSSKTMLVVAIISVIIYIDMRCDVPLRLIINYLMHYKSYISQRHKKFCGMISNRASNV